MHVNKYMLFNIINYYFGGNEMKCLSVILYKYYKIQKKIGNQRL
jgi:hypothetical protein